MKTSHMRHLARKAIAIFGFMVLIYAMLAYLALPEFWYHREHKPGFHSSAVTTTSQGIPGDSLNIGLVGEKVHVITSFLLKEHVITIHHIYNL